MSKRGCAASHARTRWCRWERPRSQSRMTGPRTCRARWRRNRRTCGPRMFIRGWSAKARVMWRRRGDTTRAPMPETFSWERARTDSVGVAPHRAHVRRSTGIMRKPVSSSAIRWAPSRRSFFYLHPLPLTPLTDPAIVALFGARLGPLRAEATGAQQSADVVGMVDDVKAGADHRDDPSTGPETRSIPRGFRPCHDHVSELASLGGGQLGRAPCRGAWPRAPPAPPPIRHVPPPPRTPDPPRAP